MRNKSTSEARGKMKKSKAKQNLLMELAEDMVSFVMHNKAFKKMKRKKKK